MPRVDAVVFFIFTVLPILLKNTLDNCQLLKILLIIVNFFFRMNPAQCSTPATYYSWWFNFIFIRSMVGTGAYLRDRYM
jgi:hypothetical protein